jgi:excisionase family DNA binding protein
MNAGNENALLKDIKCYSLTELESVIGVTHRTLLTYVKTGKLKAVKVGGRWKVKERDLCVFLGV